MNMDLHSLETADVRGKRFFVRCDFDVPLVDFRGSASSNSAGPVSLHPRPTSSLATLPAGARRGSPALTTRSENHKSFKIADDTRLISGISTIEYLLENGATVIAAGHLGRPEAVDSIQNTVYSLEVVAKWFAEEFPDSSFEQAELGEFKAWKIKENFYILENLRFHKEEEENSRSFAESLASLADFYVNEAFSVSHRDHASIVGIPKLLPHFAGFHLLKEIKILSTLLESPKRPLTVIIGGAKIETKLPLVSKMHRFADYVLVGGEIAEHVKELLRTAHEKTEKKSRLLIANLNSEQTDITSESLEEFVNIINQSGAVVWNGPMGYLEKGFMNSSLKLAEAIISSAAYKVVGGGDTIGLLNKHSLLDKFNFASVGGGAMLEFLAGENLPGLSALQN